MPQLQEACDNLKHNSKTWGKYEETEEDREVYKKPEIEKEETKEDV